MKTLALLLITAVAFSGQDVDRALFDFEAQIKKENLKYKKKRTADEAVFAHRNVTLRVQFGQKVNAFSAWIVPRRDYRDNKQTLDFLSGAVKVFCQASESELKDFRLKVAETINHTKSTPIRVAKCDGELRHVVEFMSWELTLQVR